MSAAKVIGIYIAKKRGDPTILADHVRAVPGAGLEGDRYFKSIDNPNIQAKPGRQITLIEAEAIEAMQKEGINISPGQTRRNIITRGINLNNLVGRLFTIGDIKLRGIRLCEPCQYLADRTDPRIINSMTHRGGLRAEIISEGTIAINDNIITYNEEIP